MIYKVERATSWEQVEEAATASARCIQPDKGMNWGKAKETWETLDNIVYFIMKEATYPTAVKGYLRLFNTTLGLTNPTWAVDYMWPQSAEAVRLVADQLDGNVLVKNFLSEHVLARNWPKVHLSLNIPNAPYRVANEKVSEWLIVI